MIHIENYQNRPSIQHSRKWKNRSRLALISLLKTAQKQELLSQDISEQIEARIIDKLSQRNPPLNNEQILNLIKLFCQARLDLLIPKYSSSRAITYFSQILDDTEILIGKTEIQTNLSQWIYNPKTVTPSADSLPNRAYPDLMTSLSEQGIILEKIFTETVILKCLYFATLAILPLEDIWHSRKKRRSLAAFRQPLVDSLASFHEHDRRMEDYYDYCGSQYEGQLERRTSHYHAGYSDFNFQEDSQLNPLSSPPRPARSIRQLLALQDAVFKRQHP